MQPVHWGNPHPDASAPSAKLNRVNIATDNFTSYINYQSKREQRQPSSLLFSRQPDDRLVMPFVRVRGNWVIKHPVASLYFQRDAATASL
jgi:hypothetical protein